MELVKVSREGKVSLMEALDIEPRRHRIISLVGAGGKTTLIYELARELRDRGITVAVTTTTHMGAEGRYGFKPIGQVCGEKKIKGISREFPAKLLETHDAVLVEADGSRRLPFKVPEEHEPVLAEKTDLVIGVAGASAVGQTFAQACCRCERACACLGRGEEDGITPGDLVKALTAPWGQRKGVSGEYRYVISQGDLLLPGQMEEISLATEEIGGEKGKGCLLSVWEQWYCEI